MEKQKQQSSILIAKKCQDIEDGEYEDIKIAFPTNNHQSEYTYEEDQYLIYITNKYGYGNWDDIMKSIKTSEDLLFNYFLKSRNKIEIQKRIDYLVKIIEKELGPISNNERTSSRRNKENKEKTEEDNNSFLMSNMSKISSANKKEKKKDEISSVCIEGDSNKKNNININLDEDEDEEENNNSNNNDENEEDEKENNNIFKRPKIEEKEVIKIENDEEIDNKKHGNDIECMDEENK